ncbi:MAG: uroporphyrinogen-III synthase [Sphingorhabdus sp.]
MRLLIIRPEPGATASAKRAHEAGFEPVVVPFFEVRPRDWVAPNADRFDALLITSANAVRHAGSQLQVLAHLPVHAVGINSAQASADAGLRLASTGMTDVADAIEAAAAAAHRRLIWLAGEDRTLPCPPGDMRIEPYTVYASEPLKLSVKSKRLVEQCPLVALHSARAAHAFADYIDRQKLKRGDFLLAAFSSGIANVAGKDWKRIAIAKAPNDQALLSAAWAVVKDVHNEQ